MYSHQHQTDVSAPPNTQTPQTPEWIYDEIMRFIEPDLMLGMVDRLEAKYRGETPEQFTVRRDDYLRALDEFDVLAADIAVRFRTEVETVKQRAAQAAHAIEESEKQKEIRSAESQIDRSDSSVA